MLGLLAVELRDMHSNTDWLDDVLPLRDPTELPRVLTRADAQRHGISPDAVDYRVRAGIWQRLAPAVYLAADRATDHDRAIAATVHGGPRAVLSGASRLRLLNMRAVRRVDHDLVLVPMSPGAHSWKRIRVRRTHRMPDPDWAAGVRVAPIARAVADCALDLTEPERVCALVAEAVQRGLCEVEELQAEYEAGPRRGSAALRRALVDVGIGARSVPEARAGRLLRAAGIDRYEQNADVQIGNRRFVADFLWPRLGAILEIDSIEYHLRPADHAATLARDQLLQSARYVVLHVQPSQLRDGHTFVAVVRAWLESVERRMQPKVPLIISRSAARSRGSG